MATTVTDDIKKQIERGWLSNLIALTLMGGDVDLDRLDNLVRRGKLTTKMDHDSKLYKLDDVLAIGKVTAKEVLDRHWPVDRRKKPTRYQQKNILKTKTERDSFSADFGNAFPGQDAGNGAPGAVLVRWD